MNTFADRTSAEVAEEAENERAGLVNTLDQLRENLRPANVVDEVFSQAQAGSSDVMDRIWSVARANPIPAALIGLGAAMIVGAGQRFKKRTAAREERWPAYEPEAYDPLASSNDGAPRFNSASGRSSNRYDQAEFPVVSHGANRPLTGLARLLDEQPLILAALGVAVGAAVGSAIPSTDVESQWMGDASESMRRNASAIARDQLSQLRTTATQTLDQMKATAAEHGVSSENVSGLVHDLGEDVKTATFSPTPRPTSSASL